MASSPPPPPLPLDLDLFSFDSIPLFDFLDDPPLIEGEGRLISPSEPPEAFDSSLVDEIERFLMADDGSGEREIDPTSCDLFLASGSEDDGSSKSTISTVDLKRTDSKPVGGSVERREVEVGVVEEEEDDDAAAKKKRRQLRNRDSAMKSRERRKLYVQDLERKCKFLDAECRHLQQLLQCCTAENIALKHRLHSDRTHGAHGARQESAVLFEESLLLGSLFWLMSTVFLLLALIVAPGLKLELATVTKGRDLVGLQLNQQRMGAKGIEKRIMPDLFSEAGLDRRRFKAFRRKMKISPIYSTFLFKQYPCMSFS